MFKIFNLQLTFNYNIHIYKYNIIIIASSQISQRLKQSYKQSTNRIVSSFRNERINNHVVRQFKGHTDGVWEVNVYSRESDIIGSASLGLFHSNYM